MLWSTYKKVGNQSNIKQYCNELFLKFLATFKLYGDCTTPYYIRHGTFLHLIIASSPVQRTVYLTSW